MKIGVGSVWPNSSIDRSRSAAPDSIRGTIPQRPKASTLRSLGVLVAGAARDVVEEPVLHLLPGCGLEAGEREGVRR